MDNKKMMILSFLIAIVSITVMIIVIPKIKFVNSDSNYIDGREMADMQENDVNCEKTGKVIGKENAGYMAWNGYESCSEEKMRIDGYTCWKAEKYYPSGGADWFEYMCKKTVKKSPTKSVSNCKAGDTCCEILGDGFVDKLHKNVLGPLKIIAPILLLVFTAIDFAKIVFSDNKDGMAKAWKNFGRRAVATILIFFAWNIVAIIYGFISGVGMCTGL